MLLYFGRGFVPSTLFLSLLLLLLSTAAVSYYGDLCNIEQYNPDVFNATTTQFNECSGPCTSYVCKINTTVYFGMGCRDDVYQFCTGKSKTYDCAIGQCVVGLMGDEDPFDLYQKYMEEVKQFGDDSLQERFFWLETLTTFGYNYVKNEFVSIFTHKIMKEHRHFWAEKVSPYFSMNLQNFTNEIQNSEIHIKDKIEEKVKAVVQLQTESSFNDIQNAANHQSLPENEYFQKKFAEMEVIKMKAIKVCAENVFKSYLIMSNETLLNVETEMNNAEREAKASIVALNDGSGFEEYRNIQANILQKVSSNKEKVLDLLMFANETMENITSCINDEIGYFQSAGYEARKAMNDYKNGKEMKDLMKEIKEAVKAVKKIGEAAQKTADNAKTVADESNMTAENAEKTAQNAKEAADSAGKNAEALHSNGRKNGGFEGAMILSFLFILI